MMKRKSLLLLALLLTLVLVSCTPNSDMKPEGETEKMDSCAYTAATVKEMTALTGLAEGDTVMLRGYSAPSDNGGGLFFFAKPDSYTADGGTVFELNDRSGMLVRICEPDYRNICWFGANGSDSGDDCEAISAAINSLPQTGGTVSCPSGTYMLFTTLNIGDGDTASKASSINNIRIVGDGGQYGTVFKAASELDALVSINGSIAGIEFDGIELHCELKAKTALKIGATKDSRFANLYLFQYCEKAIELYSGSINASNISENNSFLNICTISTYNQSPLTCLDVYGDYESGNPVRDCTFTTCRFDTHQTEDSVSAAIAFAADLSFYRCHFANYTQTSVGVVLDALKNDGYPKNMTFYDCSVDGIKTTEDDKHKIGQSTLYGYGTYDNETLSGHEMICGITDDGTGFSMKFKGVSSGLPEKRASFALYSNAEFSHNRLNENGKKIAVQFNNGVSWRGGTLYCPSYSDNTGSFDLTVYKWKGTYEKTVAGEKLYTTTFKDFTDNSWLNFDFDSPLAKGEYLLVLDNARDTGYGVGVWTKGKGAGVVTYENGVEADYGLVGEFYLE